MGAAPFTPIDTFPSLTSDRDTTPGFPAPDQGINEAEYDLLRLLQRAQMGLPMPGRCFVRELQMRGHSELAAHWALHRLIVRGLLILEPVLSNSTGAGQAMYAGGWHNYENIAVQPSNRLFDPAALKSIERERGRESRSLDRPEGDREIEVEESAVQRPETVAPITEGVVPMTSVSAKRFRIALSFPGEQRAFTVRVAEALAGCVGRDRVLYDKWYEAEFARPDLDTYLQRLYHDESDLIVIFLCADYNDRQWCGLEWRAIRDLIKQRRTTDVMPLRFDNTEIPGLFSIDGYVWIGDRSPEEIAALILQRWQVNTADSTGGAEQTSRVVSAAPPAISASLSAALTARVADGLLNELKRLPSAWFEQLVFKYDQEGSVPGKSEAQSVRAIELRKIMRSRPSGLETLRADLEHFQGTHQ